MRRVSPVVIRLGVNATWPVHSKLKNSGYIDSWLINFRFSLSSRLNNLQVSILRRNFRLRFKRDRFFRTWLAQRRVFKRYASWYSRKRNPARFFLFKKKWRPWWKMRRDELTRRKRRRRPKRRRYFDQAFLKRKHSIWKPDSSFFFYTAPRSSCFFKKFSKRRRRRELNNKRLMVRFGQTRAFLWKSSVLAKLNHLSNFFSVGAGEFSRPERAAWSFSLRRRYLLKKKKNLYAKRQCALHWAKKFNSSACFVDPCTLVVFKKKRRFRKFKRRFKRFKSKVFRRPQVKKLSSVGRRSFSTKPVNKLFKKKKPFLKKNNFRKKSRKEEVFSKRFPTRTRRRWIDFSFPGWRQQKVVFWSNAIGSRWPRLSASFKITTRSRLAFKRLSPVIKSYVGSLFKSRAYRSARVRVLTKRAGKIAKFLLRRRGFIRAHYARVVSSAVQYRRRCIVFSPILFSRAQLTPRWNSRRWLMPPLRYYLLKFQNRKTKRRMGFFARRKVWITKHARYVKPTWRRFVLLNAVERQLTGWSKSAVLGNSSLRVASTVRNSQLFFFTSSPVMRLLYQATVYKKLAGMPKRMRAYPFFSSLLGCAFMWRNVILLTSILAVEFRRTRYHYRFFKLFSRFLAFFLSSRTTVKNLVVRVRGCFGRIARTRSLFLRPLSRFHVPIDFRDVRAPVRFSFRNVTTQRGAFGLAVWIV